MNPPFTRNEVRGEKFGTSARDAMRRRERVLRDQLGTHDPGAAAAVNPNSIQTFFVVLAHFLAGRADGRVVGSCRLRPLPRPACARSVSFLPTVSLWSA